MVDLSSLILPYQESESSHLSLYRINFTDELDHYRYSIHLDNTKSVSSLTKINSKSLSPVYERIRYVDNSFQPLQDSTLSHNLTSPLLIQFPNNFSKLKLSIGQCKRQESGKSLLIVKSNIHYTQDILKQLQNQKGSPSIQFEVSKLNYDDLPFNTNEKVTINDSFNSHNIHSDVTVSLWELDENDNHQFYLKFSIWIDPPPKSRVYSTDSVLSDPIGSMDFVESRTDDSPIHVNSPRLPDRTPSQAPIDVVTPPLPSNSKKLTNPNAPSRTLQVGNFKRDFNFDIEDGPNFRKAIKNYDETVHHYKKSCFKLYDDLKSLETCISRLFAAKARCMDHINGVIAYHFSPILKELNFSNELEAKVNKLFDPMERNLRFFVNDICNLNQVKRMCQNLNSLSQKDSKNKTDGQDVLEQSKKIFENNSKEYYSWLNKYLSNEKDRPESKLLCKRKDFELSKFDYLNQLNSFTNNQYINKFLEGLFKFLNLNVNEKFYLHYDLFRDVKLSESLLPHKYNIYLLVLSRFNSEKAKFRQLIEASLSNEELTKVIRYSSLNHNNNDPMELDSTIVDEDNLELIFESTFDIDSPTNINNDADMSGILYALHGKGKAGWHKEWVVLKNGQLIEFADWRKGRTPINTPIEVALSNVKQISYDKRQNCIEINTSTGSKHVFQAINADEANKWAKALYLAGQVVNTSRLKHILKSPQPIHTGTDSSKFKLKSLNAEKPVIAGTSDRAVSPVSIVSKTLKEVNYLELVRSIPDSDNNVCADCGSRESIEWVSVNLLVAICVECASSHRNLGSHISKIRSLKLDKFDEELQYLLKYVNNRTRNSVLESQLNTKKLITSPHERLQFIKLKYCDKKFVTPTVDVGNLLVRSVQQIDVHKVLEAIIFGADTNMNIQFKVSNRDEPQIVSLFVYSLRKYIEIEESVPVKRVFIISELLILNGCNTDAIMVSQEDMGLTEDAIQYCHLRTGRLPSA